MRNRTQIVRTLVSQLARIIDSFVGIVVDTSFARLTVWANAVSERSISKNRGSVQVAGCVYVDQAIGVINRDGKQRNIP